MDALIQDLLFEDGWNADEPWTPLRRDLTEPEKNPGVRTEAVGPEQAHVFAAVHGSELLELVDRRATEAVNGTDTMSAAGAGPPHRPTPG